MPIMTWTMPPSPGYHEEIIHFISCILTNNPLKVGLLDGIMALKMASLQLDHLMRGKQ